MEEKLIPIGMLIILIGFILVILGVILMALRSKTRAEWAVGGILWFIPFGFGTKENLIKLTIVVSAIFLFLFIVLNLMWR